MLPKKRKTRSPRTAAEAIRSDNYTGSHCCVQCARRKKLCAFDGGKQKCQLCEVDGLSCQVIGKTWLHSQVDSKLGRRSRCVCCVIKKQKCSYSDNDEYNFNARCNQCTQAGVPCWVGVNYRGMRNHTTLLSGVHDTFVTDNDMQTMVATVVFDAASKFKPTFDYPLNNNGIVSTIRPARARNNFGKLLRVIEEGRLREIVTYDSGCGATSVGTTYK